MPAGNVSTTNSYSGMPDIVIKPSPDSSSSDIVSALSSVRTTNILLITLASLLGLLLLTFLLYLILRSQLAKPKIQPPGFPGQPGFRPKPPGPFRPPQNGGLNGPPRTGPAGSGGGAAKPGEGAVPALAVLSVNGKQLQQMIAGHGTSAALFHGDFCGACKAFHTPFSSGVAQYQNQNFNGDQPVTVKAIEAKELLPGQAQQLGIKHFPTVIGYRNGQEVGRLPTQDRSPQSLVAWLNSLHQQ